MLYVHVCVYVCDAEIIDCYQFQSVTDGPRRHHGICLGQSGQGARTILARY